jgi:hypothetical protein
MAGFVQIVEFSTSKIDEVRALAETFRSEMQALPGETPVQRATLTADRDRPGYYLNIVEFNSYDSAMENSERPQTTEFATKMAALCDGPPTFYNLDVVETWTE